MRQAQARETKVLELQAEVAKVQRIDDTFKVRRRHFIVENLSK